MQISVVAVGKPGRLLHSAIREYEARAGRYWKLEITTVKAEPASRNRPVMDVRQAEADRLRAVVPAATDVVALTRAGEPWTSEQLAAYLNRQAVRGGEGASFLIGGAFGLHEELIRDARHRLSLSAMTLPHDMARLFLAEQLYRAGTIVRGQPYHKG